jgi:aspartyl protease family protein
MRFVILILGITGLVLLLQAKFPYAINRDGEVGRIIYLAIMIALLAGGGWLSRYSKLSEMFKQAAIWLAIILALLLVYSYRDTLQWKRIKAELFPNQIQMSVDGGLSVRASEDGHFYIEALVNGVPVNFLVDTGASDIVLSPRDAQRAGFVIELLEYNRVYNTANGRGAGAGVTLDSMKVGIAAFRNVPASVNRAEMEQSLLGMSFLRQFKSYTVDGYVLTLYP